jgi:hypothetical protein
MESQTQCRIRFVDIELPPKFGALYRTLQESSWWNTVNGIFLRLANVCMYGDARRDDLLI